MKRSRAGDRVLNSHMEIDMETNLGFALLDTKFRNA